MRSEGSGRSSGRKKMHKIFLDANVFLFGYQSSSTNSFLILENVDGTDIKPVISYRVLEEVQLRSKRLFGRNISGLIRLNISTLPGLIIIPQERIEPLLTEWDDKVTDKSDLPHICGYFAGECDYFITSNRKLTQQEIKRFVHFISPKRFIEKVLKIKSYESPKGI